jgi:CRP/FNR family transcriptional regulator, cyclic AMP receptor protein
MKATPDKSVHFQPTLAPSDAAALEKQIAAHPLLRGMKSQHVKVLAACAMLAQFKEGELIFREGDPANRFYLLEEGKVSLESPAKDEASITIQMIGVGDVLGWSWLFPPYYWHFDARALESVKAIFFYGTWLREYCEQDHDLGYELMKRMAEVVIRRLQATREQLLDARRLHPI